MAWLAKLEPEEVSKNKEEVGQCSSYNRSCSKSLLVDLQSIWRSLLELRMDLTLRESQIQKCPQHEGTETVAMGQLKLRGHFFKHKRIEAA
jgi:hypothetical protein